MYALLFGIEDKDGVPEKPAAKCCLHVSLSSLLIMKEKKLHEQKSGNLQRTEKTVIWSR